MTNTRGCLRMFLWSHFGGSNLLTITLKYHHSNKIEISCIMDVCWHHCILLLSIWSMICDQICCRYVV